MLPAGHRLHNDDTPLTPQLSAPTQGPESGFARRSRPSQQARNTSMELVVAPLKAPPLAVFRHGIPVAPPRPRQPAVEAPRAGGSTMRAPTSPTEPRTGPINGNDMPLI